ncbi:hypothetical protein VRZ08_00985 [Rhodopseudomonas sp. G2_2311]|uniref:hypothetical protein n=1 Tax=Rhodopseudomonas sp. G2_2311 TaxID=3114287 RepID=UPI0039C5B0BC
MTTHPNSDYPAEGDPVGQRWGRFPERLPGASVGFASVDGRREGIASLQGNQPPHPFKSLACGVQNERISSAMRASISARSPLERGDPLQAALDVFAVLFLLCFGALLLCAVGFAFFIWLFLALL